MLLLCLVAVMAYSKFLLLFDVLSFVASLAFVLLLGPRAACALVAWLIDLYSLGLLLLYNLASEICLMWLRLSAASGCLVCC